MTEALSIDSLRAAIKKTNNLGGPLAPFGQQDLLKLLHAVFAGE